MWTVDGRIARKALAPDSAAVRFMDRSQYVFMNFWTPTWMPWGENLDLSSMPWFVQFDFVEAYSFNQDTRGFDLLWRDDFDSLDLDRWFVSDQKVFGGSDSWFVSRNVYTENGSLVLRMEPSDQFLQ